MKAKTLLELLSLSSSLYMLSKDEELMAKLRSMAEKGKDKVNKALSEPMFDEEGKELEIVDKLIRKSAQVKEDIELKIEEMVAQFYKKVNIAHLDEIKALNEKLKDADKAIALLEARINKLEQPAEE